MSTSHSWQWSHICKVGLSLIRPQSKRTMRVFLLSVLLMILHQHWCQRVIVDNDLTFVKLGCPSLGHKVSTSYDHEITWLSKLSPTAVSWMNWIWVKCLVGSFSNIIRSIINSYTYSIISFYGIAGAYLAPQTHIYLGLIFGIIGWISELFTIYFLYHKTLFHSNSSVDKLIQ